MSASLAILIHFKSFLSKPHMITLLLSIDLSLSKTSFVYNDYLTNPYLV